MTRCKHCGEEIMFFFCSKTWVHKRTQFKVCKVDVLSDEPTTAAEPEDDKIK